MSRFTFGFLGGGGAGGGGGLTSVGLSMPSAFTVTNSPLITNGVLNVIGAGNSNQYIDGTGALVTFPTNVGGGSAVVYYLNGSVNQGVIGGNTYYQMSDTAVFVPNADFNINADGYIAQFITDSNVPQLPFVPGGAWQFQLYFSASSGGGSPQFYVELYKYDGTTFTLIGSNSGAPENITGGTSIDLYTTLVACPQTPLNLTDRIAIRVYVIHSGRTITLHTQGVHICKVTTTFTYGLVSLNGLTDSVQYLQVGTSGTDFNITQSGLDTHVFNLPDASATSRGALTSADWTTFNNKQNAITQGNLTETTSNVLTIFGGTGAVIGLGTTIQVQQSSALQDGYLSSTDWTTFNNKFDLPALTSGSVIFSNGTTLDQDNANFFWDNVNKVLITNITRGVTRVEQKPSYVSSFVTALSDVGNGINAQGSLILREWSTGAGKLHTLGLLSGYTYTTSRDAALPDASGTLVMSVNGLTANNNGDITLNLSGYVPYTGANQNVNLGTFNLTTPIVYGNTIASGTLTLSSTSNATKGNIIFGTSVYDEVNNRLGIGTSTPTEKLDISGTTKISGNTIWLNQASPSGANYTIKTDALKTEINDVTRLNLNINANTNIQIDPSLIAFSTQNSVGAVNQDFTFVSGSKVSSPSGVAFPSFKYTPGSRQWVSGTIANQEEVQIVSPLYGFTSASTITNAYSLYVNAPTAGVNATITNNYAAGFSGNIYVSKGILAGSTNTALAGTGQIYAQSGFFTNSNSSLSGIIGYTNSVSIYSKLVSGSVFLGHTASVNVLEINSSGLTISDNYNVILGSSNGTKIGTATTQKLGFFNATPIVQPTAVTTVQGIANALSNLGLIASSPNVSIWNVTTQTGASYSATNSDYVLINAATQIVTLPTASANARIGVKMINATVTSIQVRTPSVGVTIDGVDRSSTGLGLFNQYDAYVFVSDGTNWWIES